MLDLRSRPLRAAPTTAPAPVPTTAEALVVEDDPRSAKLMHGYLERDGYRTRSVGDGPSAIRAAHERIPDVVFLDLVLPGMSGAEVCGALKGHPHTRLVQVMMVSSPANGAAGAAGPDLGADDYIVKPVRRDEFLARARALVRMRRLLLELDEARAGLAARDQELELKKTLAQVLVHDLKNPLGAIIANLELLSLGGRDPAPTIGRCRQSAERMLKMVLDLLDVDALEGGRFVPSTQPVDLQALVERAAAETARGRHATPIDVASAEAATPAMAAADPALIRRVVDNLLGNAVTHSPAGARVVASVDVLAEGVQISVADAGRGIAVAHRELVFEKYAQLDLHLQGETSNRGLGLTFCRLAVEAHGGSIWIEDAPGGGALFRVLLPAADEAYVRHDGSVADITGVHKKSGVTRVVRDETGRPITAIG